jgi:protein TonB
MTSVYFEDRKYKIISFVLAIAFSSLTMFLLTFLKVDIYKYKMPKEIKIHLVNTIPLNKEKNATIEHKAVEKKIVMPKEKKIIKHHIVKHVEKPKPVEKPIASKIPPPEPQPYQIKKPVKQNVTTQTTYQNMNESNEKISKAPQPIPEKAATSTKPTKDQIALYLSKVYEIIEEHKHYPSLAKERGDSGTVYIRVSISASGKVDHVSLLNSSGSFILDEYTKELIKHLKFPAPPKGPITFDLKVHYRLNEGD